MNVTVIPIVIHSLGTISKGLVYGLEDLKIIEHPHYSIIKIGQNTNKNPRDLRRLAVSQTPVENLWCWDEKLSKVW